MGLGDGAPCIRSGHSSSWLLLCRHRIQSTGRAIPSMGQAGNVCAWGEPLHGAGRDAPGMLQGCSWL